jgi:cysteine desulfurase
MRGKKMKKVIYLDNGATTIVNDDVAKEVNRFMLENYGNASSIHQLGRKARDEIEKAREKIAKFIHAEKDEIIFTSGGTESNNLAIRGLALANPHRKHIITTKIEHPCVIETCKELEKQGYRVNFLHVDQDGLINFEELKQLITNDTLLVSIMHVNNEIGVIQDMEKIGRLCKEKGTIFHSDCVQSFGKLKIDVKKMNLSLMSVSGHKINAPKGIGFLYVKRGIKINPIIYGGGQEKGIRSGTENTAGIIGLASSLDIKRDEKGVRKSRDKLLEKILQIPGTRLNGSREKRIYNNINVSFHGIEGESLALLLDQDGICVSTGSACSSHSLEESHVLKAINVPVLYIHGSLRLTLDTIKPLSDDEINFIADKIKESVEKLRAMSPFKLNEEDKK